jgi:hypothetical protein
VVYAISRLGAQELILSKENREIGRSVGWCFAGAPTEIKGLPLKEFNEQKGTPLAAEEGTIEKTNERANKNKA